ncbi:MAG: HNH endonuclease [Rhodoferax sp.]|uniref:HNH endonuclease n=1 Tax=Rhodoferax sp. TaxID=50421 RepID=UPI0017FE099F|nr:HNH endonuclease [Rhodoferax sp.]NMM14205.1 HNH endonuclease [Rhodoferax sp.]
MNPLQRTLIEKAGHDNGFEHVLPGDEEHVALASARHPAQVTVTVVGDVFDVAIQSGSATLAQELARTFPNEGRVTHGFVLQTEAVLAQWLRRAAALSQALPNQAVTAFEQQVQAELSAMPEPAAQNTEVLRMVRQRVGQQAYRQAMLDYWGGACSVTGLALPQALRASHAKPWAECASDSERLDVYNGFLLSANLDVLFDSFLVSFTDEGELLVSEVITLSDQQKMGLAAGMRLRWVSAEHRPYLRFHRQHFCS